MKPAGTTTNTMPASIYAKVHGASTDVISGQRGLIGGWNEHRRDGQTEFIRSDLAFPHLPQGEPSAARLPRDPTDEMVVAALAVDWENEDERATVINIWHAMTTKLPTLQPSAARELALEEIIALCKDYAEDSQPDSEYRLACNDIIEAIQERRTLSSPDHADAGKVEGEGWLPIESAPEDGTVILVYRDDAGVFTAHYVEEDAHLSSPLNPPEGDFYWFSTCGDDLTGDMPTHWRPLPSAPSQEVAGS